jgi:hypothetical protein
MISKQILRSSLTLSRVRFIHFFLYKIGFFGYFFSFFLVSVRNYQKILHQIKVNYFILIQLIKIYFSDKSTNKKKSASEYLADDMYNYTTFSYYDIELSMTKYRLPQPSPSKPEPVPQKK